MKVIVVEKPGQVRLIQQPKPVPGPGDVVSKVAYSGICGTDLGILGGRVSFALDGRVKYPVHIGHEWSGVVDSVGEAVTRFAPGDRVVSDNGISCGECRTCLAGEIYSCKHGRSLGTINTWDYGSFSEYILIPERHMFHLDDRVSLEQGALIEPGTIALAGLRAVCIHRGDTVLVTGTGAVGLCAAAMAKASGAGRVIIAGRKQSKLETGKKVGADAAVNMAEDDLARAVSEETGGRGADVIIEASGSAEALDRALDCAGPKCRVALIGFYEDGPAGSFNFDRIVLNNLNIQGITGGPLVPDVMELMACEKIELTPLITHIFPLEKGIEAFTEARENSGEKIKILIQMN
ncbi:MAG: alcohol dehydrogenase catalytic domain-containing protein [Oscillospiraceae bacterium]|nr:alcohol dehydrogenase catalytic domain-containing protein [Oscillospiraceae bacterium]